MFTLALGIAVNATVFSWIDSVLLHPYPGVTDTRGLALIETVTLSGEHLVATSYVDYRDYREADPASPEFAVRDVVLPEGVTSDRAQRRRDALYELDRFERSVETLSRDERALDSFYERSYRPGGRHQLPNVAESLSWRPQCIGQRNSAEPASADHHRSRSSRFSWQLRGPGL